MEQLILLWENEDGLQKIRLSPGKTYYIGRPRSKHLLKYPGMDPAEVYIIPEDGEEQPVPTGIISLLVSRLDTKITIDAQGYIVSIKNHGPTGYGAKNPTYVNGELLPPGKAITINLKTTPTIILQLTSVGPTFIITREEDQLPLLSIPAGIPVVLPTEIVSRLEKTGLIKEQINWEGGRRPTSKVVVVREEVEVKEQLYGINKKLDQVMGLIIQFRKTTEQKDKIRNFENLLIDVYMAIDQGREHAMQLIEKLKMQYYKDLVKQLSQQDKKYQQLEYLYQQLLYLLDNSSHEERLIKKTLQQLINIIRIR